MKKCGFTLAEVLITLGIIGVVAAMTIPNLIANTNGAKFKSQFKKTLSTLNQAGLMAQAQYDFDFAGTTDICAATAADGAAEHPEKVMTFCSILNGTLTGQTYVGAASNLKRNANGSSVPYEIIYPNGYSGVLQGKSLADYNAYILADGSIVAFNKNAKACELPIGTKVDNTSLTGVLANCQGFIDVNGVTLPNREVTCSAPGTSANAATTRFGDNLCVVKEDANHMTDIFPIVFHDATVGPGSNAVRSIMLKSK
ncbi:type II secretion system protein [bacterium]|nr:type II secretion system protein [bacterium]